MKDRLHKCLQFGLVGVTSFINVFCITNQSLANQSNIIPDNTLGAESSRLNRNVLINGINADSIDGGAKRSGNLFHSFSRFSIDDGQSVYFSNPSGVENILTRVTGGNASNILGTLGVDGAANLFLINPSGIVFGENASLDVQGSFLATTASGIQFGEKGTFSAINPETPGNLTVNPSALFFNQVQASGGIINKSQAPAGINPDGDETTGLRVPDGKSFLLVGGDINFDGGRLRAYEGNVELASVAASGNIGLDISGNTFNLNLPEDVERGDISLTNIATVSIFGASGGNLVINARNLEISESAIYAGIGKNSENPEVQAGDINLNATGFIELIDGAVIDNSVYSQGNAGNIFLEASNSISVAQGSIIANNIEPGGVGKGGDIQVKTRTITLTNGSQLSTSVSGEGNAGNIFVEADDSVKLDGFFSFQFNGEPFDITSNIRSRLLIGGVGKGGDIQIVTKSLSSRNGTNISASADGQGDAGNVTITVSDTITFDGVANNGLGSRVTTSARNGNSGNIDVKTGSLFLTNSARMNTVGFGQENSNNIANGGDITINARDTIKLDGANTALISELLRGTGEAGDIQITTGSLSVTNGASISASTSGAGDAGNININARDTVTFDGVGTNNFFSSASSIVAPNGVGKGGDITINTKKLSIANGALLNTLSFGKGNAGNVFINAIDSISLDGVGNNGIPGGIQTFTFNDGDAGEIQLTTGLLSVTNGALLNTFTFGQGDAGKITINARDKIIFDGVGSNAPSGAFSTVESNAVGNAGDIELTTGTLSVSNGAQIKASTLGQGNGGKIDINASESVKLSGVNPTGFRSALLTSAETGASGNPGDINVTTNKFRITDGAFVSVGSFGKEDAGDIFLQAETLQLDNGFINAETASTKGGDINLQISELLLLRNESQISTTAGTAQAGGDGGNIDINSKFIVAPQNENSDITANAFKGNGGKVNIISGGIFGIESQESLTLKSDITASSEGAIAGEININAADTSSIQNSFTELSPNIDTDAIIANSCIVRSNKRQDNSFTITGSGGLRNSPGDELISIYSTGEVRNVEFKNQSWKKGDPIIEPQGLYRLSSGELLLSREC